MFQPSLPASSCVYLTQEAGPVSDIFVSVVTAVLVATVLFYQLDMEDQRAQTCNLYQTDPNLPHRFNNPDCFHGYGYVTTTLDQVVVIPLV